MTEIERVEKEIREAIESIDVSISTDDGWGIYYNWDDEEWAFVDEKKECCPLGAVIINRQPFYRDSNHSAAATALRRAFANHQCTYAKLTKVISFSQGFDGEEIFDDDDNDEIESYYNLGLKFRQEYCCND